MEPIDTAALVRRFWQLMDAADFAAAGEMLADDYICDWPQSRERIRGRANFAAVNVNYPGRWRIAVRRLVASAKDVASEVVMTNEEGKSEVAISFFEVQHGRIARETDYWPEPYVAPLWRAHWVEPLEH